MKTSKAISTISYNSLGFLKTTNDDLINSKIISFYTMIQHEAEPEEIGDDHKKHCHLRLELARMVQTEDLRELYREPDPNNTLPLGVQPFRLSKWADWYLYVLHDPTYLASKHQERAYVYTPEQIITSDQDYMNTLINEIEMIKLNPYINMIKYIREEVPYIEYATKENIDIRYTHQFQRAYETMRQYYNIKASATKNESIVDVDAIMPIL